MSATQYTCEVRSIRKLTPTVYEVAFEALDGEPPFRFRAGQFVSVVVPGAGPKGRDLRRAYSVASNPEARPVELCIKLVEGGPGTNYLCNLKEGDRFKMFAPYGSFVYKTTPDKNVMFIATGTGVAPFRSMVFSDEFKSNPPRRTMVLFGVGEAEEVLYEDEFKANPGIEWVTCLSRVDENCKTAFRGRVTHYLEQLGDDFPWLDTEYYLCGNGAMIDQVKVFLMDKGVPKTSLHLEVYYKPPKAKEGSDAAGGQSGDASAGA